MDITSENNEILPTDKVTGKQMCELIVEWLNKDIGIKKELDPMDLWNYSPTGELSMVFEWYQLALKWKQDVVIAAQSKVSMGHNSI